MAVSRKKSTSPKKYSLQKKAMAVKKALDQRKKIVTAALGATALLGALGYGVHKKKDTIKAASGKASSALKGLLKKKSNAQAPIVLGPQGTDKAKWAYTM